MKKFLLVLTLTLSVLFATPAFAALIPSDPAAHAGEVNSPDIDKYLGKTEGYRPSVWMVGDSLGVSTEPALRKHGVSWEITAIAGRNVSTMPYYVDERKTNPSPVSTAILSLGTNAVPGWTKANFRAQADRFNKVMMVTTYRDPVKWPNTVDYRRRAIIQYHYSAWMREIDSERPNTCVADWRKYIEDRYRVRYQLLASDGVHLTELGKDRRALLLINTFKNC